MVPTAVSPSPTETKIYDALFTKVGQCLRGDARLLALQDICAKTLDK